MRNTIKILIILLVFTLTIVGCSSDDSDNSTSTPDVTSTPDATPTPDVTPTPDMTSTPATTSASIMIDGLGDSILVTNQNLVTIKGVAESNVGINHIEFTNETTGVDGTATGTESWSTEITLNKGDNALTFTVVTDDNIKTKINTVLTYYPNLKFTSALTLSENILYVSEAKEITFTVGIDINETQNVKLFEVQKDATIGPEKGVILDDGVLPDEIQKDGVFTTKQSLTSDSEGKLCYRVGVLSGATVDYYSEIRCILVTNHYTSATITKSVELADNTKNTFDLALAGGANHDDAMKFAADELSTNPDIGAYGYVKDSGIWWISNEGILGGFHPALEGQKAAGEAQVIAQAIANSDSKRLIYYPTFSLNQSLSYDANRLSRAVTGLEDNSENVIHSNKGIIISPYINNPDDGPDFGTGDDYYKPWASIKNKKSCQLYASKEVVNNGNVTVALSTFIKSLGDYGYIHVSTHGENFYNGLFSLWDDQWGDKTALSGALSQVVLYTGLKLPKKTDGTFDITGYENLLKAKYIAIYSDGAIAFLPAFIRDFGDTLPNSIVVLSACRSMYNNSLANAYISKGAGAVIGYTDYVKTSYAQNTLDTILEELYNGKTIKEAVDEAIKQHGSNDSDATPAYLTMTGNSLLALSGKLENAGFERGSLTPWSKAGDGRIISQLGGTSPTEGSYMGIISTGLGYTTTSGSIEQDFCLADNTSQLTFNWNFFSEEFIEWCDSPYQDAFNVQLCEVNLENGSNSSCTTLLQTDIASLCGSVTRSDIVFDRPVDENGDSGVYNTGWQNQSSDITSYSGKAVRLKFSATDVGDSVYDTAILIDDIKVIETTP